MTRALVCLLVLVLAPAAAAQSFTPDVVDMAAAKKEGAVTWYTSTPVATAQKIATLFQNETGIARPLRAVPAAQLRQGPGGGQGRQGLPRRAAAEPGRHRRENGQGRGAAAQ